MTDNVKEQMVEAALQLVNEKGTQAVTTREIASRAGVNPAAINYHFGSKDNLVTIAFQRVSEKMKAAFAMLEMDDSTPRERLSMFLNAFIDQAVTYPGMFKSALTLMMENRNVHPEVAKNMGTGSVILHNMIRSMLPDENKQTIYFLATQLISSAMYPFIIKDQLSKLFEMDYLDPIQRKQYLNFIIDTQFYAWRERLGE